MDPAFTHRDPVPSTVTKLSLSITLLVFSTTPPLVMFRLGLDTRRLPWLTHRDPAPSTVAPEIPLVLKSAPLHSMVPPAVIRNTGCDWNPKSIDPALIHADPGPVTFTSPPRPVPLNPPAKSAPVPLETSRPPSDTLIVP